jgi:hypothetical protein
MKNASEVIGKLGELTIALSDDQPLKLLRKDWNASREALVAFLAPERAPKERANATLLLFQAGDEAFAEGFKDLLTGNTGDAILTALLENISWSSMCDKSLVGNLRTEAVASALKQNIVKSDGNVLKHALLLLKKIGDPDSRQFLENEFASASCHRRLSIALILGADTDHAAAWEAILAEAEEHPPQDCHFKVRNAIAAHLASESRDLAISRSRDLARQAETGRDLRFANH